MSAYTSPERRQGRRARSRSRTSWPTLAAGVPREAARRGRRDRRGADGALPRGRGARRTRRSRTRSRTAVTRGEIFPVACGVATKNLGTHALLDLLVEGVPSPAKKGAPIDVDGAGDGGLRLQDDRRPVRRAGSTSSACSRARSRPTRRSSNARAHAKERIGSLLELQGKEHTPARRVRRGRHRRRREAEGDADRRPARSTRSVAVELPADRLPRAGDELRDHAEGEGRRGEGRHRAPPPRRGGPDAAPPPRPADRRADPRRA